MELQESFRAPFLQLAWQRHGRIAELVGRGEAAAHSAAATPQHSLSGEASMLDFGVVADLARHAEEAARQGDRPRLSKLIADLHTAITAVQAGGQAKAGETGG